MPLIARQLPWEIALGEKLPFYYNTRYTFNGPKTEVLVREKLGDDKALNDLDRAAKEHGYAYPREKSEYEKIIINRNIFIITMLNYIVILDYLIHLIM